MDQHWLYRPSNSYTLGKCSPRLAEELAKRLNVPLAGVYGVVEDLAREFPALIMVKDCDSKPTALVLNPHAGR